MRACRPLAGGPAVYRPAGPVGEGSSEIPVVLVTEPSGLVVAIGVALERRIVPVIHLIGTIARTVTVKLALIGAEHGRGTVGLGLRHLDVAAATGALDDHLETPCLTGTIAGTRSVTHCYTVVKPPLSSAGLSTILSGWLDKV
jgi:hypothetical protein